MRVLTCVALVLGLATLGFLGCGSDTKSGSVPTAPTGGGGGGGTVTPPASGENGLNPAGPVTSTKADAEIAPPAGDDKPAAKPSDGEKKDEEKPAAADKPAEKKSEDEKPAEKPAEKKD